LIHDDVAALFGRGLSLSETSPEKTPLFKIVSECLEGWLEDRSAREQSVAGYVEEEFRGYLTCGLLCFGFARALCTQCT
jgi:hypothetical protein